MLIRSGEAPGIGWSRNMLYSGFDILPRSVVRRPTGFAARITRTLCCLIMSNSVPQTTDGFETSPIGHWVGCHWNFKNGDGYPHPEDARLIQQLCPHHLTAECVAVDGKYFVLRYQNHDLRIRPFSIRIMPHAPKYPHGTHVRTIVGPDVKTRLESTIRQIVWHVKNGEYTYCIDGDQRRRKRIYFEHQLEGAT